jgi:sensor histidine kinase regulating citrate/malate metabolism
VSLNRAWFQKALSIFLENARAAIMAAAEKRIEVETRISDDSRFCLIIIKNTGAKIDDEIWEKMTQEQIMQDGNNEKGNGLLLADLILAVYGGKIEKIRNEENNIVLGMTLPLIP